MLNLKKVIALVCVFAMMLTTVAFAATYSDVTEDSAYYEAVETLNKLDIVTGYEDGTYKPEDGVTRAEMAALIARIQGYGETAKGAANTGFADVPASHWASGYIANAAGMGIINGYGDGNFGPEDPVKYEQAVKMVMATLGYTPYAEKNGGYPTGYLAAAQRYDVSLNVANAAVGTNANRGTVAQILAKAIDTPLMLQTYWNTNGEVGYEIADDPLKAAGYKTLMSENLGYVKIRGQVRSNTTTVIGAVKNIDTKADAKVSIFVESNFKTKVTDIPENRAKSFLVGDTDAEKYIGRTVIGYVKKLATDEYELISIAVDTNRNEELVIGLEQFVSATATKLSYLKEGATYETTVALDNIDIIYNNGYDMTGSISVHDDDTYTGCADPCTTPGHFISVPTTNNLNVLIKNGGSTPCLFGGTLTLVDNDTNAGYDVAIVELAGTAVVKKVDGNVVEFKRDAVLGNVGGSLSQLFIDEEDENKIVKIFKDGEEIAASDLAEWDVLSIIAASYDANYIVAEVVTNEVVGTITSSKNSSISLNSTAWAVDGTWYNVAQTFAGDTLKAGRGGKFFIDKYGKIAAFEEDAALAGTAVGNYGYIIDVKAETNPVFGNPGVLVQMLTANGVEEMKLKNNAELNGNVIYKSTAAVDAAYGANAAVTDLTTVASNKGGKSEVVKYTKNSAGEIGTIITQSGTGDYALELTKASINNESAKFDAEVNFFDATTNDIYVASDAVVFVVDADPAKSMVVSVADLDDKNTYTVKSAFITEDATDNDFVVLDSTGFTKAGSTSGLAVISDVWKTTDNDGNPVLGVKYFVDGAEVEAITDDVVYGAVQATLTVGDVVKVKNASGTVTSIEFVWNFNRVVRTTENSITGSTAVAANGASAPNYNITDPSKEKFDGGVVTAYKQGSVDQVKFAGTTHRIDYDVANIYVVDKKVDGSYGVTAGGSFKYLSKIYDAEAITANLPVFLKDGKTELNGGSSLAISAAQAYADQVFVRTYEDRVTDVIIVRGADFAIN